MEQEIQDISIQLIQKHRPQLKGIDNDLIVDYTEFSVPDDNHPIHHYPIRLDGLFIGLREKGLAKFNINLNIFDCQIFFIIPQSAMLMLSYHPPLILYFL